MHILIATPAFPPFIGGGERHTGTLARHLVAQGQTVTVLTSSALQEPDFWQGCGQEVEVEEVDARLTVIRAPIRPFPGGFRGLLAWRKSMVMLSTVPGTRSALQRMAQKVPALQELDYALAAIGKPVDLVHAFNISWEHTMIAAWRYARRTTRPFIASPLAHLGTGPRDPVALNSTMRHQRYLLSTADMLLTNTAIEARGLRERGIGPVKMDVAGPGVDIPEAVATLPADALSRKPFFLFIGRTSYDKGAIHAAQAVLSLRQAGSAVQLVLIGRETTEFQRFTSRLPAADREAICFLGFVDESLKHAYLRDAEALLLPSRSDSFGIVLLESWLYGRPVIAADAGGIPAVVDDGQNGLLVPFGDVPALASAIRRLLDNPRLSAELGDNGRQKLIANYTWEAVTNKVLKAYREVAAAHASAVNRSGPPDRG